MLDALTPNAVPGPVLALDLGGTGTRWTLAPAGPVPWAEGELPPLQAAWVRDEPGRAALQAALAPLQQALQALPPAQRPMRLWAGVTGLDPQDDAPLQAALAQALAIVPGQVLQIQLHSDIEFACRAAFPPGQGVLLLAGTGAIAGHVDAHGTWQRAGGRGVLVDDAGGGHWIARQALRQVWRAEDAQPGAWRGSVLAQCLFEHIGGPDWALTRRFVAQASRGELGRLALAVAQAAPRDPAAWALLQAAGRELARPVLALLQRCGLQPVLRAGRVWDLHPAVAQGLAQALPPGSAVPRRLAAPLQRLAALRAAGLADALAQERARELVEDVAE